MVILISVQGTGQVLRSPDYSFQTEFNVAVGRMLPFWMVSNHFGTRSTEKISSVVSAAVSSKHDTSRVFDLSYALQINSRFDGREILFLDEAYLDFHYRKVFASFGRQKRFDPYSDHLLSTGSIIQSRNAPALPEIVAGTDGFLKVPFTSGYLEIKSQLSHGWFGRESYVRNQYLHHKNLYIRLGGRFPVNFTAGLEHYALWGGISPEHGHLPDGWKAYKRIFFVNSGDANDPRTHFDDVIYKLGNHFGSRNYRIDIRLTHHDISLYHQTIFEDRSGLKKYFMRDGTWGMLLESNNHEGLISAILFEHFRSTYQSGGILFQNGMYNVDNYFNHYIYLSGWTYHKFTIGNPLITSPIQFTPDTITISNNRVVAYHFGFSGTVTKKLNYRCLITFSNNYGTFLHPFETKKQSVSGMVEVRKQLRYGIEAAAEIGYDIGRAYGNNLGLNITLIKRGNFDF